MGGETQYQDSKRERNENNSVAFSLCALSDGVVWLFYLQNLYGNTTENLYTHTQDILQPTVVTPGQEKERMWRREIVWIAWLTNRSDPTRGEFHAARKRMTVAAAASPPSCAGSGPWLRLGLRCRETG